MVSPSGIQMRQGRYRRDSIKLATNAGIFLCCHTPSELPKWLRRHFEACGMPHNRPENPNCREFGEFFVDP
jgi:hypothetical protein